MLVRGMSCPLRYLRRAYPTLRESPRGAFSRSRSSASETKSPNATHNSTIAASALVYLRRAVRPFAGAPGAPAPSRTREKLGGFGGRLVICKFSVPPPTGASALAPSRVDTGSLNRPGEVGVPRFLRPIGKRPNVALPIDRPKYLPGPSPAALRAELARSLRPLQRRRVRRCRCVRVASEVALVERVSADGEPSLVIRGIESCASVHSCPMCAARIMAERGREIVEALDAHKRSRVALVTFTLRHRKGMRLRLIRKVLSLAYSELKAGEAGKRLKSRVGYIGDVKAAEQTHGENGWHPHLHCLWFFERDAHERMGRQLRARWKRCVLNAVKRMRALAWDCLLGRASARGVVLDGLSLMTPSDVADYNLRKAQRLFGSHYLAFGLEAAARRVLEDLKGLRDSDLVPNDHGVDFRPCDDRKAVGYYLSKLGCELTGIASKVAKDGGATCWDIARSAVAGNLVAQSLWKEHSGAMKGARQLTWSRSLRYRLGLEPERTDDELVADTDEPTDRLLGYVTASQWDPLVKVCGQGVVAELQRSYDSGAGVPDWVNAPRFAIWRQQRKPLRRPRDCPYSKRREPLDIFARRANPLDSRPLWWEAHRSEREARERGQTLGREMGRRKRSRESCESRRYMSTEDRREELDELRHVLAFEVVGHG